MEEQEWRGDGSAAECMMQTSCVWLGGREEDSAGGGNLLEDKTTYP